MVSQEQSSAQQSNEYGILYVRSGRLEEAIDCFYNAIKIDPLFIDAWHYMGCIFMDLERYNEAKKCFDKTIEICKGINTEFFTKTNHIMADAWHNQGVSFGNLGDYDKAIHCFDYAIDIFSTSKKTDSNLVLDRNLADVLRKKGFAHGMLGEHDKAKDCFDGAIQKYENIRSNDKDIDIDYAYALNSEGIILSSIR
jgi:tetratricopeptide (TPR) repeat protein